MKKKHGLSYDIRNTMNTFPREQHLGFFHSSLWSKPALLFIFNALSWLGYLVEKHILIRLSEKWWHNFARLLASPEMLTLLRRVLEGSSKHASSRMQDMFSTKLTGTRTRASCFLGTRSRGEEEITGLREKILVWGGEFLFLRTKNSLLDYPKFPNFLSGPASTSY